MEKDISFQRFHNLNLPSSEWQHYVLGLIEPTHLLPIETGDSLIEDSEEYKLIINKILHLVSNTVKSIIKISKHVLRIYIFVLSLK